MTALDAERRSRLLGIKLTVLARDHLGQFGLDGAEAANFPGGAALHAGAVAAVLVDEAPARGLGRALAWAHQRGATDVHVLVEDAAGVLARRAAAFAEPPTVWWVRDRELHRVEPEPFVAVAADAAAVASAHRLRAAGAEIVVEHGEVTGEVLGLQVARIVTGAGAGEGDGDAVRVEVGVGRHDREAFAMVHGDDPEGGALADVVATVRRHRRPDAPDHPLHRLAPERWLREAVIGRPDLAGIVGGAGALARHEGPVPRPADLRVPWPAVATGDGVVVVCSVGIDLDLVPFAADARLAATGGEEARLVLLLPERDAHPVTRALAARLRRPAEVVTVGADWRSAAG